VVNDATTRDNPKYKDYLEGLKVGKLEGLRFGYSAKNEELEIYKFYQNPYKVKLAKKIIGIILALFLIFGGVAHFMTPEMYFPLIPDFLPETVVNILAGIVEIVLGIGVFIPTLRKKALLGIFILMLMFLPIHIWDALKESPAIGTKTVAMVRIAIQFVLIFLPWFAQKDGLSQEDSQEV